jgi:hypothetical protein
VTTPVTTIVAAVEADLAALGLGQKATRTYAPPLDFIPGHLPLLCVWSEQTDFTILTGGFNTAAYERSHSLSVAWAIFNGKGAEMGGTGDPAIVLALETLTDTIINRIAFYTGNGIPTLSTELITTLRSRKLTPVEGSVWVATIDFTVEEAA